MCANLLVSTMAAADIGAAELLQKGLDRQAPADAMWLNLLARYVEKPPAPGVQGDHGGFHERNCLHFSYESNAYVWACLVSSMKA